MKQILLFIISLATLQAAPTAAPNYQRLQAKQQLEAFDPQQRLSAVKFFANQTEDEETAQLLRERLLIEYNPTVLTALLDYFEKRRSREDFFYLLDFIPIAYDYKLAARAATIMATIHTERTLKEFSQLLEEEAPHFLMTFLAAFSQPDSAAREVCRRALGSHKMREKILLLPPANRKEIISLLQPYSPFELILPEKDITSVLLLTELREYAGGSPAPEWFYEKISTNTQLDRKLILEYLEKQFYHAAQQQNLQAMAAASPIERYFALRQRLLVPEYRSELTESLHLIATPRELLLLLLHADRLTASERSALCTIKYRSNVVSLDNRLLLLCTGKFVQGDLANLNLALRTMFAISPRQLYQNLTHHDSRYRLKAVLLADAQLISQHREVFQAMLLKEPNRRVRFHIGMRLAPPIIFDNNKTGSIEEEE